MFNVKFKFIENICVISFLPTDCHLHYYEMSGYIESPDFINQYKNFLNVSYTIHIGQDTYINITSLFMDIEHGEKCSFDYIKVCCNFTILFLIMSLITNRCLKYFKY